MIDEQLQKIITQLADHEKRIRALEVGTFSPKDGISPKKQGSVDSKSLILAIVNKVSECNEGEAMQSMVLDTKSMEGKILLGFYVSYKYFNNVWLTTGDIEKITASLGTKIDVGNISNKIKAGIRQHLESGAVRKKGQPTPYRLNRKGVKRFEEIINDKKN